MDSQVILNSTGILFNAAEVLKCSLCDKEVKREGDRLVKSCEHADAPVVSEMSGIMRGIGTLL